MAPGPFSQEDSQLIAHLHSLHKKSPKLVKPVQHVAPAAPEITVESWKMNESKYYDIPSPSFFCWKGEKDGQSRYHIVARGYDKFFNIGEVPWTTWSSLETHTKPPYTLTLKSNGCIIFIAALSPSKLLVTSKHSIGPLQGIPESHAQAGERWLRHHLDQVDKTTEQLAEVLWEKNWTAVAELCDDSFEEHVLPYPAEKAGLHLHGLNDCSRHFKTQSTAVVDKFAREWGFIVTVSHELSSVTEVQAFTEEIGRSGKWNGEALEGFVVRTTVRRPPTNGKNAHADASPYPPGSSFFFKIKFDEPYMMYRDWREITKSLLLRGESAKLPKAKMKRPETKTYVEWVKKRSSVIRSSSRTEEGRGKKKTAETGEEATRSSGKNFGKTVIMPVAIPGVGKTSISVALVELFRFGHTQSDNIRAKKAGPPFIQSVKKFLRDHDVVIADKNNHLHKHREDLRDAIKGMQPPVRLLALNWSLDQPRAVIHNICADRIAARGTNHQTLHGDPTSKSHEDVLSRFLKDTESFCDSEADEIIEMDLTEDLEHSLARAIDGVVRVLGLPRPNVERVGAALAKARGYKAPHTDAKQVAKARPPPRYFAILAEIDLVDALESQISHAEGPLRDFWDMLKRTGRLPESLSLWERCTALYALPTPPLFRVRLGHVVANERIMAATVEELTVDNSEEDEGQVGSTFVSQLDPEVRQRLHITIGTKDPSVPPIEAIAWWNHSKR
ncbi:RNA ligase-domain-containing protein [Russula brevipes]|nr:RNA ligase-domain-containing protein [Russula brevipes]